MPPTHTSPDRSAVLEVAALVTRLLAHYWMAEEHPAARQAQIEDWIDDLAEFGPQIVEAACREWRRSERRRPMPIDIRVLCIEAQRQEREELALTDERARRWPKWLEETWGPEPEGPRLRAEAMQAREVTDDGR